MNGYGGDPCDYLNNIPCFDLLLVVPPVCTTSGIYQKELLFLLVNTTSGSHCAIELLLESNN